MKKNIRVYLCFFILALALPAGLMAWGTGSGTKLTNGGDQGVAGTADHVGDLVINYKNFMAASNYAVANITIATVGIGYDLSIITPVSNNVGFANGTVNYDYVVTNRGNISDTVRIQAGQIAFSGTFTGTRYSIWTNRVTPVQVAGPAANVVWTTPSLAADASRTYRIVVSIPFTSLDGETNMYSLTNANQAGTGTGDNWPGINAVAPATPDMANLRDDQIDKVRTKVGGPNLSLRKSYTTSGLSKPKPFDMITYVSKYSNQGSANAQTVVIVDYISPLSLLIANSAEVSNVLHAGTVTVEYFDGTIYQPAAFDNTPANIPLIQKIRWTLSAVIAPTQNGLLKYKSIVK